MIDMSPTNKAHKELIKAAIHVSSAEDTKMKVAGIVSSRARIPAVATAPNCSIPWRYQLIVITLPITISQVISSMLLKLLIVSNNVIAIKSAHRVNNAISNFAEIVPQKMYAVFVRLFCSVDIFLVALRLNPQSVITMSSAIMARQ